MEHELPGYVLHQRIGVGAAAEVYRAEPVGAPGRVVAVKRLRVDAPRRAVEELRREAEAMARLAHPSILRILDLVPDGDGLALVLPLAPGGSLADRLATGTGGLAPVEVADLGARLAGALAAAHNLGLVHRDVKPANVLFDAEGQPLLSDLGTARLTSELAPVAGTAEYLDPALAEGAAPGPRTDVYGLGVTLYEALAGVPPYAGSTPGQTLAAAASGIHVPLGERVDAPAALVDTIERAMHRDQAGRFATASELAGRLDEARRALEADDELQVPPPLPGSAGVLGSVPPPSLARTAATSREVRPQEPAGAPAATAERSGTRTFGPAPPPPEEGDARQRGLDRRLLVAAALLAVLVPVGLVWWLVRGDDAELALAETERSGEPAGARDDARSGAPDPIEAEGLDAATDPETAAGLDAATDPETAAGPDAAADPDAVREADLPACADVDRPTRAPGSVVLEADVDGRGCTVPVTWDGQQLTVPVPAGEHVRYDLAAEPDDVLLLGDWSCDGRAAPALYRPRDGQLFVFDRFSDDATARGSASGVIDGAPIVVHEGGCDRVEVRPR
jgi:eukaryotic-like serine/threonine-protein kinase